MEFLHQPLSTQPASADDIQGSNPSLPGGPPGWVFQVPGPNGTVLFNPATCLKFAGFVHAKVAADSAARKRQQRENTPGSKLKKAPKTPKGKQFSSKKEEEKGVTGDLESSVTG